MPFVTKGSAAPLAGTAAAAPGTPAAPAGTAEAEQLLALAMSRPREAIARAREILARHPPPEVALIAHQAAGIVLRDGADVSGGIREFRRALALARRIGSGEREADVLSSLGSALVYAGRTAAGLGCFERAIMLSHGPPLGRVLHRRGNILWTLGRPREALADFRRAVAILQRAQDSIWTARAFNGRGLVNIALGFPERAITDFVEAGRLLAENGQELEVVHTVVNRGVATFYSGRLPSALALLDEAVARYGPLGVPSPPGLVFTRCEVLLAAGLARDALAESDGALARMRSRGRSTERAEMLIMAATCALAATDPQTALDRARAASRLFRTLGHERGTARAELVAVQAQYAAGVCTGRLLAAAGRVAEMLATTGSADARQASLLAGRVALRLGRSAAADRYLSTAADGRKLGPAMSRVTGWLAEALRADAALQSRRLQIACGRGLAILDEYRWTLGASELRAQATAHGAELAALAQRHAARTGQARQLLIWSERWRATALAVPPVQPPGAGFHADLAALRQATSQLEDTRRAGTATAAQERELVRLEKAVRERALRVPSQAGPARSGLDIRGLLSELGAGQLVEVVEVDGVLHVLVCGGGRVRRLTAGTISDAMRAADFARFALRRLARATAGQDMAGALAILDAAGPRLQETILGPAVRLLRDGPLVVVPPGRLHALPWALLPALTNRAFSVAPSASAWQRAHATRPPARRRVVLASGPGLATGGAEVPAVARLHDGATMLSGAQATAARVLSELDGAWLAHVAAHGSFRADSPMFSSLRLHDGPLTVYDFEQLRRAPYRLVLPSCDSGVLAPAGADELLGLVSSLLPLGTAGVVASVVPVNDDAVVPLMIGLHRRLAAGDTLSDSLLQVRVSQPDGPAQRAAAMSLVMLGAD